MKALKVLTIMALALAFATSAMAADRVKDDAKCSKADNIVGNYLIVDESGTTNARIYKLKDGTYNCQMTGQKPDYDKNGKIRLDELNPEPKYRNIPLHQSIIISGLVYNAEKKQWDGGKIHNPLKRLEKANCTVDFVDGGKTIRVFGNLMGIGKNVYWQVVE